MQELEKRYEIARLIACELIGVLSGRPDFVIAYPKILRQRV